MLVSLSIKNYALIDNLKVDFEQGFSIITGETGAGKSILLGGLALVLGKRSDSSLVYDKLKKCIIEAEFDVASYNLENFFSSHDLDYDQLVVIRREILPNGKSRAFVNDTPTNLTTLNALTSQLIDIHSQHETLQLSEPTYQFEIIDALSNNKEKLEEYKSALHHHKLLLKELQTIKEQQLEANKEYDYNMFLWEELEKANLKVGEQEALETDLDKLSHMEEIKTALASVVNISEQEPIGVLNQLTEIDQQLTKIGGYAGIYDSMSERIKSIFIEFKDLLEEIATENDNLIFDPAALESVEDRLQTIYNLQKKHGLDNVEGLLKIQEDLNSKIAKVDNADEVLAKVQEKLLKSQSTLDKISNTLRKKRKLAIPEFTSQIEFALANLEMKNTRFKVNLLPSEDYLHNGKDHLEFLMSSDKGKSYERIKKVASGGEMSRIMLAVKYLLSKYSSLPAIIFDEIDTGVSGEVSNRIADVMSSMSQHMQVITITHLPQVAAKGASHYKVFKEERKGGVFSNIKLLSTHDRQVELAEMLSGSDITESAMAHAKQLLS